MPSILSIDKFGRVKELKLKECKVEELYKKAGFKTPNGFELQHKFPKITLIEDEPPFHPPFNLAVYGKVTGKAGQENKYEFPPPLDKTLFFGTCLIVNEDEEEISNINISCWNEIYTLLMEGFEDLEDEDDDVENDKYIFDDFVVPDEEEEEEEEEEIPKPMKIRKTKVPKKKKEIPVLKEQDAIDYLSELEEEAYI